MSGAWTGGCACGAVRYEIADEPLVMGDCRCLDCQAASGTGHGSHLTFPDRQRVTLTGHATQWAMTTDRGTVKTRAFCPTCGAPVYLTFAAMPQLFSVHAGTLDDPGRYRPQMVTYGVRSHAWDPLDAAVPVFDRMPPET